MKRYILLSLVTLLMSCAATENILSDFDDTIDFESYDTYVICIDDLFVEHSQYPNYDNNEIRQLIGEAVETAMEARGHKTNVLNPELQAGFQLLIEEKEATFTNCEVDNDYNYWRTCTIDTVIYTEETLVLYVSDMKKNQIIWQASIQCDLNRAPKKLPEYISELVTQLFNTYPK